VIKPRPPRATLDRITRCNADYADVGITPNRE